MRAFRYRLPLKSALTLGGKVISYRYGILLYSKDRWSDVCPLPGFSREGIEDVIQSVRGQSRVCPPSLRFGLEELERTLKPCSVPLNALLHGSHNEIRTQCRELADSECVAVKLKVGRNDVRQEIELAREVRRLLRPNQRIRLDANRAWDFETACLFAKDVEDCDIEYIEEPLQEASRLEDLYAKTGLAYSLDEALVERRPLAAFPNAAALVYKPTLIGGRELLDELAETGIPIVFSACFESGVGIARIAQLASEFSPNIPAGLDTYSWLGADVVSAGLVLSNWRLQIQACFEVNFELLEEVEL